jgi:signal transduction histidine kinase
MEINKTHRWPYFITAIWMLLIILLGGWWLYLVFKFASLLENINSPGIDSMTKIVNMIKWEGLTFIVLMILLAISMSFIYWRDIRKSRTIGAFFASLTHELKTPLASMRLQTEVLKDLIDDESHSHEQLSDLANRLIEDSKKFESELDKSLQLARIEQGARLELQGHQFKKSIERVLAPYHSQLKFELSPIPSQLTILIDELAFKTVFKNLIENTIRHQPQSKLVNIDIIDLGDQVEISYNDHGLPFSGDTHRLGELFYRYQSEKGSGIGIYLIKQMMRLLKGRFEISNSSSLVFHLFFLKGKENE